MRWPSGVIASGLEAGFAGITAMAATTRLQGVVTRQHAIDYDDSLVAVKLLERWSPIALDGRGEVVVNQVMRFGYGSAAGVLRSALDGRVRHVVVAMFCIMWGGEVLALRATGTAPWPWRWKRSVLLTSLAQHLIYVWTVDRAYRAMRSTRTTTGGE